MIWASPDLLKPKFVTGKNCVLRGLLKHTHTPPPPPTTAKTQVKGGEKELEVRSVLSGALPGRRDPRNTEVGLEQT